MHTVNGRSRAHSESWDQNGVGDQLKAFDENGECSSPLVTKTLVFLAEGSEAMLAVPPGGGGNGFRAFDKATGEVVWETQLPAGATGPPITYMFQGKQYLVVAVGGTTHPPEFVAFGLGQAALTN